MHKIFLPILLLVVFMFSCGNSEKSELRSTVDSFSVAYFNWQFQRAKRYSDNQSLIWLRYAASQVNQEDVDSLKAMKEGAAIKIKDINISDDENSAVATVEVRNFLSMDSIGRAPHIINKATFQIPAKHRNGQWKISLKGLPL